MKWIWALLLLFAVCIVAFIFLGRNKGDVQEMRIFHAAGLAPILDDLALRSEKEIGLRIISEGSGSQVACRKLTELGRTCDVLMLADRNLVQTMLPGYADWCIEFAFDEVVLGVGTRAKYISDAETNWASVLLKDDVRIGRVDENQGPIGYRTLLVWELHDMLWADKVYDALMKKCYPVVDDVGRLTPLLRNGELDYAFAYKSVCIANDVRYIDLDKRINLGDPNEDYSGAKVTFEKLSAGDKRLIEVTGAVISWSATIPTKGADTEKGLKFLQWLLVSNRTLLDSTGFQPAAIPRFYGARSFFASGFFGDRFKLEYVQAQSGQ